MTDQQYQSLINELHAISHAVNTLVLALAEEDDDKPASVTDLDGRSVVIPAAANGTLDDA